MPGRGLSLTEPLLHTQYWCEKCPRLGGGLPGARRCPCPPRLAGPGQNVTPPRWWAREPHSRSDPVAGPASGTFPPQSVYCNNEVSWKRNTEERRRETAHGAAPPPGRRARREAQSSIVLGSSAARDLAAEPTMLCSLERDPWIPAAQRAAQEEAGGSRGPAGHRGRRVRRGAAAGLERRWEPSPLSCCGPTPSPALTMLHRPASSLQEEQPSK